MDVLGHRMRYLTGGHGVPVVLLHGLADNAEAWGRILPALARDYQVFAPDLLGCGLSDKPAIDYSLSAQATYLRHFMDAVGAERAIIVGHSLGGALALHLYMRYPERVARLALIASGGMGRDLPLSLRLCTLAGSSAVIGALLGSRHTNHPAARVGHHVLGRLWPATAAADRAKHAALVAINAEDALANAEEAGILDRLREPAARAAFLATLRSVGDMRGQRGSALDALPLIDAPVLLIHGERDATIPVSHGQTGIGRLRRGRLALLPNCGHCPQREAPEQVTELLLDFFAADEWPRI
ncbi:MAG TPA: alpha/beta fold hydrolase [Ktedonobacterales bacterium]|nr:alpha/beta fold hydrolase [Ktedonobacterales bacterium]